MEVDEYRRMAEMEDSHWWYTATRRLLAQELRPYLLQGGRFLDAGGVFAPRWHDSALAIHQAFRARRLSPGGSADLLAACLFVHAVEG